jgi:outer membrane cobalamin receptor
MGSDYFNDLNDVKIDINMNLKLGIENILKKDYKTYYLLEQGNKGIGISSIVVPMELLF